MSDDLLKSAARALREETVGSEAGAKFTRARVMASLHQSQVRRRTRLAFVLPIAACFAAASAFGMVSGRAPELVRDVTRALGFEAPGAPPERSEPKRAARGAQKPPAPPLAAVPSPPPERSTPEPATPLAAVTPSPGLPSPSASARRELDPAHDLYRAAHRAHFTEQDHPRALAAWESYLRQAPRGRFAIEAEYNRALCLARLGRGAEARAALTPFAAGQRGGYRQSDARELLDALGAD